MFPSVAAPHVVGRWDVQAGDP